MSRCYGDKVDWEAREYPTPAISNKATYNEDAAISIKDSPPKVHNQTTQESKLNQKLPGSLPASASELSKSARGLLMRLLERDPRLRLRNLRQLQQTAFYMGFKFDHLKAKKVSPKMVLEKHFPDGPMEKTTLESHETAQQMFTAFDQLVCG